jgi:hypothetical protein
VKKKIIVLCLLTVFFAVTSISALSLDAIGGSFSLDVAGGGAIPGAALSLRLDNSPLLFGTGFTIGKDAFSFGFTVDYWMYHTNLGKVISMYIGPGAYISYANALNLGLRVPIGFQFFPIEPLELFIELAPSIGVGLGDKITFPNFGIQTAFGFRFWFRYM